MRAKRSENIYYSILKIKYVFYEKLKIVFIISYFIFIIIRGESLTRRA